MKIRLDYNPFNKKSYEKTEHGIINYEHDMGTTYVTHRKKEHYFKKYQGYAISITELEICYNKKVHWVIILYHRDNGTTIPYRIKLKTLESMEEYDNKGDIQKIIPTKYMQTKKDSEWKMV